MRARLSLDRQVSHPATAGQNRMTPKRLLAIAPEQTQHVVDTGQVVPLPTQRQTAGSALALEGEPSIAIPSGIIRRG